MSGIPVLFGGYMNLAMIYLMSKERAIPSGALVVLTERMTLETVEQLAAVEIRRLGGGRLGDTDLLHRVIKRLQSEGGEIVYCTNAYIYQ